MLTSTILWIHWDRSAANQVLACDWWTFLWRPIYASWRKKVWNTITKPQNNSSLGSSDSIDTDLYNLQIVIWNSGNVRRQLNISRFYEIGSLDKTTWRAGHRSAQNAWLRVGYSRGDNFGLKIALRSFVMQRWIFYKRSCHSLSTCWICGCTCKTPLSLISRRNKEHDVYFWQPPHISRSHLYRSTIPWTPKTAIYRECTVF